MAKLLLVNGWLVRFGEIHAVGVLQADDYAGKILDFEVSAQDLDVEEFTLAETVAIGSDGIKGLVAVVRIQKFLYSRIHDKRLSFLWSRREYRKGPSRKHVGP